MSARRKILRKARRRVAIDRAIRFGALGLCVGATAAILLVGIDRVANLAFPWQLFAGLSGGGLIAGLIFAIARTPPAKRIAVELDSALHLRDRLGTAEAIDRAHMPVHTDPGFAEFARRDAERWAAKLDIRAATPITISRMWGGAIAACLALAAAILWLPSVSWASSEAPLAAEEQEELNESRETAAREIESILDDLQSQDEQAAGPRASEEDLSALDALAEQMQRKDQSPEDFSEARDDAANQLNQLAEQFERDAKRDERIIDELDEQFRSLSELNESSNDAPTLTDELRDALAEGDYERAAELIDELSQQIEQLPEEAQQSLSDELHELSDQIENAQQESSDNVTQQEESIREALRDQGLDEQSIDDLLADDDPPQQPDEPQSPESDDASKQDDPPQPESDEKQTTGEEEAADNLARELQEQGVDEEVSRDLAEEIKRQQQNREAQRKAEEKSKGLSESFDEMADEMERESQQETERYNEEQPSENQESDQEQQREVESDEQDADAERDEENADQTQPEQQDAREGEQGERDPIQEQSAAERAKESLREFAEQRDRAEDSQEQADRLRESARRMSEQMTPEERKQYESWARELQKESSEDPPSGGLEPGSGESPMTSDPNASVHEAVDDDVDLRDPAAEEQTIAEWFDDEQLSGDPARTDEPGGRGRSVPVRDAQRAAERAVSGSSVPKRYHDLIQKYFDRFREAVENADADKD